MDDETLKNLDSRLARLELQASRTTSAPTVPKYDLFVAGGVGGGGGAGVPSFPSRPYAFAYAQLSAAQYPSYPTFDQTVGIDWTLDSLSNSFAVGDATSGNIFGSPGTGVVDTAYYHVDWDSPTTVAFTIKQIGFYLLWGTISIAANLDQYAAFSTGVVATVNGFSYVPLMGNFPTWMHWDSSILTADKKIEHQHFGGFILTAPNQTVKLELETTITTHPIDSDANMFAIAGAIKL